VAERPPERHDLAWLGAGWREGLASPLDRADEAAVVRWVSRGLPAVVRRADEGAPPGSLALGLALPPSEGRRRVALTVGEGAVARRARPLALSVVLPSTPAAWRAPLAALDAALRAAGAPAAVYGSLAWQHLTAEPYLREGSDVDLLVQPASAAALERALGLLQAFGAPGAPPLDGEVLLGAGRAVSWRELARGPARVLVKWGGGVALRPRPEALGALAAAPSAGEGP
jgi:phosphoribosyl-dephospho-CoA transferase